VFSAVFLTMPTGLPETDGVPNVQPVGAQAGYPDFSAAGDNIADHFFYCADDRLTAAPTRPTRRALSGMYESTFSGGTRRIPLFGCAAHDTMGTSPRAATLRLDEEHGA
jgi:hypothetical protein